jgi:predicted porin
MNKTTLALVIAGLASSSAFAQSNVTIYGIVDTSIRYVNHDNAAGNSNIKLDNGAISNSRIGFKGTEDLGGGLKANFRLENGFSSDTGALSSSGVLFSRQSWVGLSNSYGQLRLGRQNTPLFDLLADHFDPLTVGNYDSNSWLPAGGTLVRTSNMVRYDGSFNNFAVGVSYAMGETAGSVRTGSQFSSSLQYTLGSFSVGGGYQQTVSSTNNSYKASTINLNVSYVLGAAKLFAGYYNIKDSTGAYTSSYFSSVNSLAYSTNGIAGIQRRDNAWFLGSTYQLTPAWSLTGAGYYDTSKNVSLSGSGNLGSGKRYTLVAETEYALSKRTQLYGTVDYNKVKGAQSIELANGKSQTGLGVGIRHIF